MREINGIKSASILIVNMLVGTCSAWFKPANFWMKFNGKGAIIMLMLLLGGVTTNAGNPLVPINMADPHIHIFNNKAYMYTTRDVLPADGWNMPDWQVWSSDDLVNWKKELVILPSETYIGESHLCFASDAATRNGKYYFYFSNYIKDAGVMVSDNPYGPFVDALGKPLIAEDLTTTKEYDISVPVDDDGFGYIVFGANNYKTKAYHIAKLNPDMISLAEHPKPIKITGGMRGSDKPNLHIHKDKYYLSIGANYAISENIYGPYRTRRTSENDDHPYGFNQRAHGNFFDWKNQSFYVWCRFQRNKKDIKRDSHMTYVHYRKNGDMVYDEKFLAEHYATGVGQYEAGWSKIEAEWYMAMSDGSQKTEIDTIGFEISNLKNGDFLYYPNIQNFPKNPEVEFLVASSNKKGGRIEVRLNNETGDKIGEVNFKPNGSWTSYQKVSVVLKNIKAGQSSSLVFVFKGQKGEELLRMDSFRIRASND